jgi:hypothetical protein
MAPEGPIDGPLNRLDYGNTIVRSLCTWSSGRAGLHLDSAGKQERYSQSRRSELKLRYPAKCYKKTCVVRPLIVAWISSSTWRSSGKHQ